MYYYLLSILISQEMRKIKVFELIHFMEKKKLGFPSKTIL